MVEPDNLILTLLREMCADMGAMRAEVADLRGVMATKADLDEVRAEVHSLRADVASDMVLLEKRLGDQIATLRRSVMEYHSSVIGHGVLYTEIEGRVRRIERHLKLDAG